MLELLEETRVNELERKEYLYDTQCQSVIDSYKQTIYFQQSVIGVLISILLVGLVLYWIKSDTCKYYRKVLKENLGNWK